jgi:filamentous hemagglutinin family protein
MVLGVQGAIAIPHYAQAQQVVPDATLPLNSTVSVNGNNFIINGGTQAGGNLFHSFSEFSVPTNGFAFFNNAQTIQNIISRVTGSSVSNIDGILGANGTANLFLLNPNGIVFGPNARLNLGGSFVASTASSLNFADGTKFSATIPQNTPLLTVSVPLGLQFGTNAGSIQNQSSILLVQPGNTLALVGGDVSLNGGIIGTLNGQIELGGLAASGIVGLNADNLRLSFPEGVQRADVSLTNGATVNVFGGGGNIAVNARNLNISGGSQIAAAIQQGLEALDSRAANIEIDATDTVTLDGTTSTASPSGIANFVQGVGTAGNILINTGSLNIIGNALISSVTQGQGDGGSVTIRAHDEVSLSGSSILSGVDSSGIGNGGDINIQARSLSLSDGARIGFVTTGQGDAGSVTIRVRDAVSLSGSSILSVVDFSGIGNGGDINIQGRSLSLSDGAQLATSTLGTGNAGNIQINTLDNISINNGSLVRADTFSNGNAGNIAIQAGGAVSFDGIGSFGVTSGVFTLVGTGLGFVGTGRGGDININGRSLSLTNGAQLNASTFGQGNAGNVNIRARDAVSLLNDALISAETFGQGTGGNITVTAEKLVAQNGGQISAGSGRENVSGNFGRGGNITINVSDLVELDGEGNQNRGGLFTETASPSRAGDLTVNTRQLIVKNGAAVSSGHSGSGSLGGDGGNLTINATEFIDLIGRGSRRSALVTEVNSLGNAGNLTITTGRLSVRDGAIVTSSTLGKGNAGSIFVQANNSVELDQGLIFSIIQQGAEGIAGDIDIWTRQLSLKNGGQIAASVSRQEGNIPGGRGRGGNIRVNASEAVNISGVDPDGQFSSGVFTNTQRGASGQGGDITVNTNAFRIADGAVVTAQTLNSGDGGNITINANTFEADGGGQILTSTFDRGNAGNIILNATNSIVLSGTDPNFANRFAQFGRDVVANTGSASGLFANTSAESTGNGGTISIDPMQLTITDGAGVAVGSQGRGNAGNLKIQAGVVTLDRRGFLSADTSSVNGGDITLQAQDYLLLRNNSRISTNAGTVQAGGDGGNITINTPFIIAVPNEDSDILANAFSGRGGRVNITANGVYGIQFRSQPTLQSDITASSTLGVAGVVEIITPDIDPTRGLNALPAVVVNSPGLAASNCNAFIGKKGSEFTITGRGGLPLSPDDFLSGDVVWSDTRVSAMTTQRQNLNTTTAKFVDRSPVAIAPATGWIFNNKGEVTLISQVSDAVPQDFGTCAGSLSSSN